VSATLAPVQKRHDRFVREYLKDFNATQAAIRAGYSKKTGYAQGHRLLKDAEIQAKLARVLETRIEKEEISGGDVLRELKRIGLSDVGQAFDADGKLKPIAELPEDIRRSISGVEVTEEFQGRGEERERIGFTKKVKLWDKTKALEILCKHLGLLQEAERPAATTIVMIQETVIMGGAQVGVAMNGAIEETVVP